MPTVLPRWPIAALFLPFGLWWVLGLAEMAWIPIAGAMLVLMLRRGGTRVPAGMGILLLFLALMLASVIGIDTPGRLVGFIYRALQYAAVTIALVYIYNARRQVGVTWLLGMLTAFWAWVVAGGWLAVVAPRLSFRTPLGYLLPQGLQANELVQEMVVRRTTQWNPDSWAVVDPRPSAPFLYTNGWGNAYSLLLPLVLAYLVRMPRDRRFFALLVLLPVSVVPAMLTLNRGMFLGLAVAAVWAAGRLFAAGRPLAVAAVGVTGLAGLAAAQALGISARLNERLSVSSSTEDRANLYAEAFERTLKSPLLGYGAPRPSVTEGAPSVGTQGHLWTVMFSHGFPAAVVFVLVIGWLLAKTWRWQRHGAAGLAINVVVAVLMVEIAYYGVLPVGLMIVFCAAAVVLPGRCDVQPVVRPSPVLHSHDDPIPEGVR